MNRVMNRAARWSLRSALFGGLIYSSWALTSQPAQAWVCTESRCWAYEFHWSHECPLSGHGPLIDFTCPFIGQYYTFFCEDGYSELHDC